MGPHSLQALCSSVETGQQRDLLHVGNWVPAWMEHNHALGTSRGHAVLPGQHQLSLGRSTASSPCIPGLEATFHSM